MQLLKEEYYTYADYLKWDDDVRRELINGVPYAMAAPSRIHQEILLELSYQLRGFLKGKLCKVFPAPFDVRLNAKGDGDDTVVQPDISVICDRNKLDDKGCNGAPDLIIEILSESNARYDKLTKFNKYLEAGVREYWIVEPINRIVNVHTLSISSYTTKIYDDNGIINVGILDGCQIDLRTVFE